MLFLLRHFLQLVEKAEAREKERIREENKKQKKLDNAFKAMLKAATPPIDANAVWDDVRHSLT